jgi:hypothetical protein
MYIPDSNKILYFTLGSVFTLGIFTNFSYSIFSFTSLSTILFLFTDKSFLNLHDISKLCMILFTEYFLLYNTIISFINFWIFNYIMAVGMIISSVLYCFDFKICKYARSTFLIYFIIFGCLYCKCLFTLMYFLGTLKNEYIFRIKGTEKIDDLVCLIPFYE